MIMIPLIIFVTYIHLTQSLVKLARMHMGLATKLSRDYWKIGLIVGLDKDIDVVPVVKTCTIIGIFKNI